MEVPHGGRVASRGGGCTLNLTDAVAARCAASATGVALNTTNKWVPK
ncbi:MAG TPA: hypothetical protein PLR99_23215 [Polyangiaceae bacterium]|nr:hypothetical protein [Polyangiaceae bacterium]